MTDSNNDINGQTDELKFQNMNEPKKHNLCQECNRIVAFFGYEPHTPTHCKYHREAGMYDVVHAPHNKSTCSPQLL